MEQEIPVTKIEQGVESAQQVSRQQKPVQVKEISSQLSEAFTDFTKSETYHQLQETAGKFKEYVKKNPVPATLYSLSAGFLAGLLLKRRR